MTEQVDRLAASDGLHERMEVGGQQFERVTLDVAAGGRPAVAALIQRDDASTLGQRRDLE